MAAYNADQMTEAWTYIVDARFAADALISQRTDIHMVKLDRTSSAKKRAAAKLAKDPVQAVKSDVLKLWQAWQSGRSLHKNGAAFDRAMVEKFPAITATKTIERWRSEWAKQTKE